ncbi:hypothetical protein CR513_23161, partial [Mucuna pruriens]
MLQQDKTVSLLFPTQTISTKKPNSDEELLRIMPMWRFHYRSTSTAKEMPRSRNLRCPMYHRRLCLADAMLNLRASINVMPTSIYKSLNFGDLEPIGMTIQLANRSVVQPLSVFEDVLVQVNELIFPT